MIRLQRVGRKNNPSFRIVVTEKQNGPQSGKYLEMIGSYNARFGKPVIDADRAKHWLASGAKASGTMHNLLISEGVISGKKVNVLPRKSPPKAEVEEAPKVEAKIEAPGEAKEEVKEETPAEVKEEVAEAPSSETQS